MAHHVKYHDTGLIMLGLQKNRKEERKEGREEVTPLWDNTPDTGNPCQARPRRQTATLLLQASLSPDGWCAGLLMVKGDIRWTTLSPPVSPLILHTSAQPCRSKTISRAAEHKPEKPLLS